MTCRLQPFCTSHSVLIWFSLMPHRSLQDILIYFYFLPSYLISLFQCSIPTLYIYNIFYSTFILLILILLDLIFSSAALIPTPCAIWRPRPLDIHTSVAMLPIYSLSRTSHFISYILALLSYSFLQECHPLNSFGNLHPIYLPLCRFSIPRYTCEYS